MLLAMEETTKISELLFQKQNVQDLYGLELVKHGRLYGATVLNKVALGVLELTEKNKESLRGVNEACREWGLPPLEGDF